MSKGHSVQWGNRILSYCQIKNCKIYFCQLFKYIQLHLLYVGNTICSRVGKYVDEEASFVGGEKKGRGKSQCFPPSPYQTQTMSYEKSLTHMKPQIMDTI